MGNRDIRKKTDRELLEELVKDKRREDRRKAIMAACRVLLFCVAMVLFVKNLPGVAKALNRRRKDAETIVKILGYAA